MAKQVTLTFPVPDRIYQKAERMAQIEERPVTDVLCEHIEWVFSPFHINKDRPIMQREVAAYEAMHAKLWKQYPNKYIAMLQGQVVDHDDDVVALLERRRKKYPNDVVLIRQVLS
jgi:hypothetical protein